MSPLQAWRGPEAAREAAQLVVDQYGEPHQATDSELTWHGVGSWKRIVAQRAFWDHAFPAPHTDSVETFIDYRVPVERFTELAVFDGSVMVERTSGEVSARCHDGQADRLVLNLMHGIVSGQRNAAEAREYHATEFLDARRKQPTPYMERLRFDTDPSAADADERPLGRAARCGRERRRCGQERRRCGKRLRTTAVATPRSVGHRSPGSEATPAAVMRPCWTIRRAIRRFFSDQFEPGRRGTKRIA